MIFHNLQTLETFTLTLACHTKGDTLSDCRYLPVHVNIDGDLDAYVAIQEISHCLGLELERKFLRGSTQIALAEVNINI